MFLSRRKARAFLWGATAILLMDVTPVKAKQSLPTCNATITFVEAKPDEQNPNVTDFTFHFHIDVPNSAGTFEYNYVEIGSNGSHEVVDRSGPSWASAQGSDFDVTDVVSVDPSTVSNADEGAPNISKYSCTSVS